MSPAHSRPSLSLVIAVYNAVQYLEFILEALTRQTFKEFEVIVADDGSGPEVRDLLERVRKERSFPIQHLWQEDHGFRKNVVLNRAIASAHSDYLVFIDGDCLPHHEFLKDHWSNRQTNALLCGRRMNLSRQLTSRLTTESIRTGSYEKLSASVWLDGMMARSSNLEDAVRIGNPLIRRLLHRNRAGILGCNFSVDKRLLESINGFDEDYHAPGIGEDTDIAFRLELVGVKFVTLRYLAVLYHLFHPPTIIGDENRKIFDEVRRRRKPVCSNGLRKLQEAVS